MISEYGKQEEGILTKPSLGLWKVSPGWNRVQACKIVVRCSVFSLLFKHKVN